MENCRCCYCLLTFARVTCVFDVGVCNLGLVLQLNRFCFGRQRISFAARWNYWLYFLKVVNRRGACQCLLDWRLKEKRQMLEFLHFICLFIAPATAIKLASRQSSILNFESLENTMSPSSASSTFCPKITVTECHLLELSSSFLTSQVSCQNIWSANFFDSNFGAINGFHFWQTKVWASACSECLFIS